MAKDTIKIKAQQTDNVVEVKALIKHVMETGLRKDEKSGEIIPAHFIKEVNCEHNGNVVFVANWANAVAKNPYLSFRLKEGNAGDTIKISWLDNLGDSDTAETTVIQDATEQD